MKADTYAERIEIRDRRNKAMYRVDDTYLNGWAKRCGVFGTAVYNSLCRHSDLNQRSFPSIALMAVQHNISERTVMRAIGVLEKHNIIRVLRRKHEKTKRQLPNVYVLTDKRYWKQEPGERQSLGSRVTVSHKPGDYNDTEPGDRRAVEGSTEEKVSHLRNERFFVKLQKAGITWKELLKLPAAEQKRILA